MLGAESRTTCWEWEHGVRCPSTEQLITMASIFGVRFVDLVPESAEADEEAQPGEPAKAAG